MRASQDECMVSVPLPDLLLAIEALRACSKFAEVVQNKKLTANALGLVEDFVTLANAAQLRHCGARAVR